MYNKKKVASGTAVAYSVLVLMVLSTLYLGTVVAYPIAGVGGFTVEASQVSAQDVYIHPGVSQTSTSQSAGETDHPTLVLELSQVEFSNLLLTKDLDVSTLPGLSGAAEIRLDAGASFNTSQLLFQASSLRADTSTFNGFIADERQSSEARRRFLVATGPGSPAEPTRSLVDLNASAGQDGLTLGTVKIQSHYLAADSVPLESVTLGVRYDPDGDGTFEYQFT